MWFHQRHRWMTASPLTGTPDERLIETTSGLDHTQQRGMNMFFDLQRNIEHERQAIAARRRADERAGEALVAQP